MENYILLKDFVPFEEQKSLIEQIRNLSPGFFVPETKWGNKMRIQMNCLGWHWNARDYKYHRNRVDFDGEPAAAIPESFQELAKKALAEHVKEIRPYDICIVNHYEEAYGTLGLHQDNSESAEALASGYPVVSVSIGSAAIFLFGGLTRQDPVEEILLESGDVFIFGGTKRLAFHGIKQVLFGSSPHTNPGRYNLTFRMA